MVQFSGYNKKQSSKLWIYNVESSCDYNHGAVINKDLCGINKLLLLLNENGDPSFVFKSFSSYK